FATGILVYSGTGAARGEANRQAYFRFAIHDEPFSERTKYSVRYPYPPTRNPVSTSAKNATGANVARPMRMAQGLNGVARVAPAQCAAAPSPLDRRETAVPRAD